MTVLLLSLATLGWLSAVVFFWRAKAWLPYYVLGAAGGAILLVTFAREVLPIELWIRIATATAVDRLGPVLGLHTRLTREQGTVMVVAVPHHSEWTLLRIGLESSGLLELATLTGLLAFFPAGGARLRTLVIGGALAATFCANIARVLVIVAVVTWFGQDSLQFAHIFLGRILFFVFVVFIYWFAITRPTLRAVARRLEGPI